jgi:cytochrome c5
MWWAWYVDEWSAALMVDVATLPPGYIVHMPQALPRQHLLGEAKKVLPHLSVTGHEQHEKTCAICGAVRVTIVPKQGDSWREWREAGSDKQSRWPAACRVIGT